MNDKNYCVFKMFYEDGRVKYSALIDERIGMGPFECLDELIVRLKEEKLKHNKEKQRVNGLIRELKQPKFLWKYFKKREKREPYACALPHTPKFKLKNKPATLDVARELDGSWVEYKRLNLREYFKLKIALIKD